MQVTNLYYLVIECLDDEILGVDYYQAVEQREAGRRVWELTRRAHGRAERKAVEVLRALRPYLQAVRETERTNELRVNREQRATTGRRLPYEFHSEDGGAVDGGGGGGANIVGGVIRNKKSLDAAVADALLGNINNGCESAPSSSSSSFSSSFSSSPSHHPGSGFLALTAATRSKAFSEALQTRNSEARLSEISSEFIQVASNIGQRIIEDHFKPIEARVFKPADELAGIAGGVKYCVDGILFKLADPLKKGAPYVNSYEYAAKAAGHDLRGAVSVLRAASLTWNDDQCGGGGGGGSGGDGGGETKGSTKGGELRVMCTLQALIDHCGFRLQAMTFLTLPQPRGTSRKEEKREPEVPVCVCVCACQTTSMKEERPGTTA